MWHFIAKILLVPIVFINSLFVFNIPDPVPTVSIMPTVEATVSISPTKKPAITATPKRVYITPTNTPTPTPTPVSISPPTIDQLKHLFTFCAQSVAIQEYCDTTKTLDQYYSSQNFRNAMDMYIAKDEATRATQQNSNTQTYVPSYNYPAPTPSKTFQEINYERKLCDSVGGFYLSGKCSVSSF